MENKYPDVIPFVRRKDYNFVRELRQGGCGVTVLLRDSVIDEYFVCKKYCPASGEYDEELFQKFIQEVKFLCKMSHKNIVRIFNHHLYPDKKVGYIVMEYIDGEDIESFLRGHPENVNDIFVQVVDGFKYLESMNILHRDIRPYNIMITSDGVVKIIDFGFGKKIENSVDYDKSIVLNGWCDSPKEFGDDVYDFSTEVYFVGKLFERIVVGGDLKGFEYASVLEMMCQHDHKERIQSFDEVGRYLTGDKLSEVMFENSEINVYRDFADCVIKCVMTIESSASNRDVYDVVISMLYAAYRKFMLEETVPCLKVLLDCFIDGSYTYVNLVFSVDIVRDFIDLLNGSSSEKVGIILDNIFNRLDSVQRYSLDDLSDVPF